MKKISVRFSDKAAKNLLAQFSEQMMTSLFEIREFCGSFSTLFSIDHDCGEGFVLHMFGK